MASIVKAGGGNIMDMTLMTSTVHCQRSAAISVEASKIKANFICPQFIVIHFDGKVIQFMNRLTEDRLAIIFSSPTNFTKQFAASPVIPDGTGASQAIAIYNVTDEYTGCYCWPDI